MNDIFASFTQAANSGYYIIFTRISGTPEYNKERNIAKENGLFQIDIFGAKYETVVTIGNLIIADFEGKENSDYSFYIENTGRDFEEEKQFRRSIDVMLEINN
ncbi:MAG: hypothetical protein OEM46_03310 [Ignavibacteria bacterium]|nr:hypothetical protein [Ignavibacteria bacterium]